MTIVSKVIFNTLIRFNKILKKLSPAQTIIISFLLVIILGAILLYLPCSHIEGIKVSFLDALFTATSAVCVTGLTTLITASTWTLFGKLVILCLIQIGGLSLITFLAFFAVHLGKKVTIRDRLTLQTTYNSLNLNGMIRMVLLVIRGTLIFEGIGTIILFIFFLNKDLPWHQAFFYGLFHAISAFCNAGFDILGDQSLMQYSSSFILNMVVMILIIVGGIGFAVWNNIIQIINFRMSSTSKRKASFSLHTKLVIVTSLILLIIGSLYFLIAEQDNPATFGNLTWPHKILASSFQSTTLRTAGFSTINQGGLKEGSKLFSSILMLIGGSPGGTAGGIKTVTIAIVVCSVWGVINNRYDNYVFGRTLSHKLIMKAITIILLMLLLWCGSTGLLSITEQKSVFQHSIIDLLYETASALGTVGLTTGITPFLSNSGKIIIMICMFIGRIGPITLIISLAHRSNKINTSISYPNEEVMIG